MLFAAANPYAPIDRLGEFALEPYAGTSWTFQNRFGNRSEVIASAGTYNVLAHRTWDTSVPGTFYTLATEFWF